MKSPTVIVNDAKAFVRSTATTIGAAAVGFTAFTAGILGLGIVPDQYQAKLVAASTVAGVLTVACRQVIAWLDPKNPSFGRVRVEAEPEDAVATEQDELAEQTEKPDEGVEISQDPNEVIESEVEEGGN
jgi:hypothetical protein